MIRFVRSARRRQNLCAFLRRRDGERGAAAVEFAFILPTMLILFTGIWIYGTVVEINRKVTLTARNITDLVTQYETLTTADMTTLMNSGSQVMAPFALTNAAILVAEVTVNSTGQASIVWSESLSGGTINDPAPGYTPGTVVVIPSNMVQSAASGQCPTTAGATSPGTGSCVIWGSVTYTYTPSIGYQVTGPIALAENLYMNPRLSTGVLIDQATTTP
jgi:Flp pilus assembly protein TadG